MKFGSGNININIKFYLAYFVQEKFLYINTRSEIFIVIS